MCQHWFINYNKCITLLLDVSNSENGVEGWVLAQWHNHLSGKHKVTSSTPGTKKKEWSVVYGDSVTFAQFFYKSVLKVVY